MPPRFAYWTIILEGKPTAFRAQDREDLLPTLRQLTTKHPDAVMKWFARGRLWESPDEARAAERRGGRERRTPGWRPGGEHRDPRARFDVPRDEKRRRFAEKLRRDRRDAGPPAPESRGTKPFERADRGDTSPGRGNRFRPERPAWGREGFRGGSGPKGAGDAGTKGPGGIGPQRPGFRPKGAGGSKPKGSGGSKPKGPGFRPKGPRGFGSGQSGPRRGGAGGREPKPGGGGRGGGQSR